MNREELRKSIDKKDYMFIDLRDSNSFNGWRYGGEVLEGHIRGAINIRATWIKDETIQIDKNKTIVLCYNKEEQFKIGKSVFYGAKKIDSLDMRVLKDEDLDLVAYYENYKLLVPPEYIEDNPNLKIFHVGFGLESETSREGHIEGSIYIDTDEVEPPPLWRIGNKEVLERVATKYGLNYKDEVIVTAWDQMAAFRVATIFEYMGIENVKVLNGGLNFYKKEGFPLELKSNKEKSFKNFGVEIPNKMEIIKTTKEVYLNLEKETFTLVDNRTIDEHKGRISGYSYYDKAARIPKSKFGYAGFEGANSLDYYRNIDGTMRSKEDIEYLWRDIDLKKPLAFMCGSGWRAAEVYFYAKVIGYKNISIYSDGWFGWSSNTNNPVEKDNIE